MAARLGAGTALVSIKDAIERTRAQIVWLLAQGRLSEEVAQVTGYCIEWVRVVARRYNAKGLPGLVDRRHDNAGHAPLLGAEQVQALEAALGEPPEDAGLWNGPKVAHWMEQTLGRPVKREIGWELAASLGLHGTGAQSLPHARRPRGARDV
jgi:transposase